MHLDFWHWWALAMCFLAIEVFVSGMIFLWMAVGAVVVGMVMLLNTDMSWQVQWILFAVISLISIIGWSLYRARHPIAKNPIIDNLGHRGQHYVGRTFTLDAPIVNGYGKLKVDDTVWKIAGDDRAAGARVRVVGVDGVVLLVEVVE